MCSRGDLGEVVEQRISSWGALGPPHESRLRHREGGDKMHAMLTANSGAAADPPRASPLAPPRGVLERLERYSCVIIAMITLGGALLRVFDLGDKSLWLDEAVMFRIADGNLGHVLAENVLRNSAPPLFAVLLAGVARLGSSEAALRSLACLAGITTIPAIYLLCRRWVAAPWALFGAFLVALSPTQIAYSQQVREYSLTVLLAFARRDTPPCTLRSDSPPRTPTDQGWWPRSSRRLATHCTAWAGYPGNW